MTKKLFINSPISKYKVLFFLLFLPSLVISQQAWNKIDFSLSNNPFSSKIVGEEFYERMTVKTSAIISNLKNQEEHFLILPNEKGDEETFLVVLAPILSLSLSEKYPNIKTYIGQSISRSNVRARISLHSNRVNAWIKLPEGPDFFVQPVKGKKNLHFTYLKTKTDLSMSLFCKTNNSVNKRKITGKASKINVVNDQLRIFRIAIAATVEFTKFFGDDDNSNGSNKEDAYGAVVSSLNRISSVFEDELSIRLELVSDESLIYEDEGSSNSMQDADPFSGNFASELQKTLDEVLGNESYDVGHLFDYGEPNGDAGCIGCVCQEGAKGQGFSTHPFVDVFGGEYRNDYFDMDFAGHEIGHQFGAYHTYSFESEGTGFNAEPGSGTTIMGYAGIVGEDNVQLHGDPYFHYFSIQNILSNISTLDCGTQEALESNIFDIDAGIDYSIPIGTAYELIAKDFESQDNLTFCWEQLDSGQVTAANFGPNNVIGSMARSLPPQQNKVRNIPKMDLVLSNELTQENPVLNSAWETVPMVGRTMKWGLSIRKSKENFIQLAQDEIEITVIPSAGPFFVTSQNSETIVWKGGALETVSWNVAQTNQQPINASKVKISLSNDGGVTFPIILIEETPNDGIAQILVPNNINTNQARIKVKPLGGIFFAINQNKFSVESRDLIINFEEYSQINCLNNSIRYNFDIERKDQFNSIFSLQLDGLINGVQVQFSKSTYSSNDSSGYISLVGLSELSPADIEFNILAIGENLSESYGFELKQRESIITTPLLIAPKNQAIKEKLSPELIWEDSINNDNYRFQLSLEDSFTNILLDTLIPLNQFDLKNLNGNTQYFWRVQNQNFCSQGPFSDSFSFTTNQISCLELSSLSVPKPLQDASNSVDGRTAAIINVNFDSPILDLDIVVDLDHTWLEDLTLYLETPEGTRFLLSSELGGSNDDYTQTIFDQEANVNIFNGTAPFTGRYKPTQSISSIYGISTKGIWKLIVEDGYIEDTGTLFEFTLNLCVLGEALPNSDNDSTVDQFDNCPEITNEDQSDIDNNGIGDVCDIFSSKNITLTKKDTSCPNKSNGVITLGALADFIYKADINGPNGYVRQVVFTNQGKVLEDLAAGVYEICIYSDYFIEFEYCFETEIIKPDTLDVLVSFSQVTDILDLEVSGSLLFEVHFNDDTIIVSGKEKIQLPITQKLNHIMVKTYNSCQGVFDQWFNFNDNAKIFPNPVIDIATLILPKNKTATLFLFAADGELVWSNEIKDIYSYSREIPMANFFTGWYILKINYGSYSETLKLLKQ